MPASPVGTARPSRSARRFQLAVLRFGEPVADLAFDHLDRFAFERTKKKRDVEIELDGARKNVDRSMELDPFDGEADARLAVSVPIHGGTIVREALLVRLESANGGLLGKVLVEVVRDLMLH